MKKWLILVSLFLAAPLAAEESRDYRQESRELVQRFAAELQADLQAAMQGSGPVEAITVCSERAPLIAAGLARESGAKIGRTSLRVRNPANLHEPWQYPVLVRFDQLRGERITAEGEHIEAAPAPGVAARYMKAIPVQPVCLACHGQPQGELKAALDAAYPHDAATGYAPGEVRGAFHVTWPDLRKTTDLD